MEMTCLGKTGLFVTRSAFGALPIQRLTVEEAVKLLLRAYDAGINFYDTARNYTDSEEKLGAAFAGKRSQIIIATKTSATTEEKFWLDLNTSLKNLRTDYIDIYQFHNPDPVCDAKDSPIYACMLQAQREGKIRHIGVTCHKITNARLALNSGLYATIQYPLSALSSDEEILFAQECGKQNVGFIAMKALSGGLLDSAAYSMAYLRFMPHVVPIWGFQFDKDLDEVIQLENNPPLLDEKMKEIIAKHRKELTGDFCRGCGYCLPCTMEIRINWMARMPQLIRRAPYQQFFTKEWQLEHKKIEDCTECEDCLERCPYDLDIPRLLKASAADYIIFGKEHGYDL